MPKVKNPRGATTLTFGSPEKLEQAHDEHIQVQAERIKKGKPRQTFIEYLLKAVTTYKDLYLNPRKKLDI